MILRAECKITIYGYLFLSFKYQHFYSIIVDFKICSEYKTWFGPQNNHSNSPFKTCKIMNKTVRKILQAISYLITLLLGAAESATLM